MLKISVANMLSILFLPFSVVTKFLCELYCLISISSACGFLKKTKKTFTLFSHCGREDKGCDGLCVFSNSTHIISHLIVFIENQLHQTRSIYYPGTTKPWTSFQETHSSTEAAARCCHHLCSKIRKILLKESESHVENTLAQRQSVLLRPR